VAYGKRFRVLGSGFWVQGSGFRVLGFWVQGSMVLGSGVEDSGFRAVVGPKSAQSNRKGTTIDA
jgi:hypothetical protein